MTEAFGIDTQTSHLDLINWAPFQQWDSGIVPAFAGRNFLGGDSIWVGAEATTALSSPQPDGISKVALLTSMVAPIQGASPSRQQIPDALGLLYGKIDGAAVCRRLISSLAAGELRLKTCRSCTFIYRSIPPSALVPTTGRAGPTPSRTPSQPSMPGRTVRARRSIPSGRASCAPSLSRTAFSTWTPTSPRRWRPPRANIRIWLRHARASGPTRRTSIPCIRGPARSPTSAGSGRRPRRSGFGVSPRRSSTRPASRSPIPPSRSPPTHAPPLARPTASGGNSCWTRWSGSRAWRSSTAAFPSATR